MTLAEIIAYIETEYTAVSSDVTKVIEKINWVYRDITKLYTRDTVEENDSISTTVGDELYTLPAGSRKIVDVHLIGSDSKRRRLRSMNVKARLFPRADGEPKRWFSYGMTEEGGDVKQQFGLDPVPDDIRDLIVMYEPMPADLVEDGDTPKYIPEEKHDLIAWGALGILAAAQEDYNTSQHWEGRYRSSFNELAVEMGVYRESNFPETARQTRQAPVE